MVFEVTTIELSMLRSEKIHFSVVEMPLLKRNSVIDCEEFQPFHEEKL